MGQRVTQREGDQQLPVVNNSPGIQDMVIADIVKRKQLGIETYGTVLQANNGRDALRDLYEELLDATMYIRQILEERQSDDFMTHMRERFPLIEASGDCCSGSCDRC
jgi:hypothetical protein